jgi:hypothetical protein
MADFDTQDFIDSRIQKQIHKDKKSIKIRGYLDGQIFCIVYYPKHIRSRTEWLILTHMTL